MNANTRSTTTRTLALAVILMAAGVLFLRAQSLLSTPVESKSVGSHQERSLTALLEPVIGADQIRTSIQRDASGQTVWYIMLDAPALMDGEISSYATQIEAIATARGFDPASNVLQITHTPFARAGIANLSPFVLAEIGGLGLILLLSLGIVVLPSSNARPEPDRRQDSPRHAANDSQPALQTLPVASPSSATAAALANAAPERTANIIRDWMRRDT